MKRTRKTTKPKTKKRLSSNMHISEKTYQKLLSMKKNNKRLSKHQKRSLEKALHYKYWNESKGEGRRGSGYSGTSVWSKIEPNFVNFEYDNFNDDYGRFIYVEYETFCLINIYVPNSGGNYDYRKEWDLRLKKVMDSIQKPLIITGDFNVVSESIDIWNNQPFRLENSPGLYKHEKVMFHSFLENFIDVFRYKYPTKDKKYTWWNTITKSRLQNKGWRIDYFLIQKKFITFIKDCLILDEIMGSDHCPILLELDICQ